jgi:DNA-binding NtrC family response regulator
MSIVALAVADPALRIGLADQLHRCGLTAVEVLDADLETGPRAPRALILAIDAAASGSDARIASIRRQHPRLALVLLVTHGTEGFAIAALRAGVSDYHRMPADPERVAHALAGRLGAVGDADDATGDCPLVGDAEAMREVRAYIARVAGIDTIVLVTGETGTGKELVAASIHRGGARQRRPFVPINCAAIPESLLESELFGHEKGAFTGAHAASAGKLEQADGGTVFFDEVGEMTPLAQAKILRALETREIVRIGGRRRIPIDVRVIAATNQDLEAAVERGGFRKDLYYRLNVARIQLPPLRLHPEDIPALCRHYLRHFNRRFGRNVQGLNAGAMRELIRYGWPGNVRELKNLLEAVFVNLTGDEIAVADLPPMFRARLSAAAHLPDEERHRLLDALLATRWNVSRAAEQLKWSRMTMYRKMAKYRLVKSGNAPSRSRVRHT